MELGDFTDNMTISDISDDIIHTIGIADVRCQDILEVEENGKERVRIFKWLEKKGYLTVLGTWPNPWNTSVPLCRLNWEFVKKSLDIDPPAQLKPLSPKH